MKKHFFGVTKSCLSSWVNVKKIIGRIRRVNKKYQKLPRPVQIIGEN